MKAVGVRPTRGDFGLPDACIIKPGDPVASTLYFRMAKFGRDRMPHIGSERPDEAGLKLIENWIAGMSGAAVKVDSLPNGASPDKSLADPRSALTAARKMGRGELKPAERDSPAGRGGEAPGRPDSRPFRGLPALRGERGRATRLESPAQNHFGPEGGRRPGRKRCSGRKRSTAAVATRSATRARPLGPDLSTIGKLRPREDLLESILEPSRRIEPKYAAYVVRTVDGRSLTGLLVKRDEKEVVLRDGQNKEIVLAATDVEELQPSRTSLMPDGQLAGLTAQEAADLLEYLATRK